METTSELEITSLASGTGPWRPLWAYSTLGYAHNPMHHDVHVLMMELKLQVDSGTTSRTQSTTSSSWYVY